MERRARGTTRPCRKAQISMEYLAVVGISIFLLMPMIIIFYNHSGTLEDDINAAQLEKIGLDIIDAAEETYYLGAPTQKAIDIQLPRGVEAITITQAAITFDYTTMQGTSSLTLSSRLPLNMSGTLKNHPGPHHVIIRAEEHSISIGES